MKSGINSMNWFLILVSTLIILHRVGSVGGVCELSFRNGNKLYNFTLTSPLPNFPHGILSEDGFYKVAENESVLWFQLCDGMIFNHDPPRCFDCLDCGGPSRCGMECCALVADNIEGYDVCTSIGDFSNTITEIFDKQNPEKGVVLKMSNKLKNCSLSISVLCDSNGVQGPQIVGKSGKCNFDAVLKHPAGCATVLSIHGKGLGWFAGLVIVILCLFGAYLMVGAVFRYFFLGVRGLDVIPNVDFWARLPQKTQSFFGLIVRKFRGPSEVHRATYSPVNF